MKIPFVREWGSWVVFVSSVLAALAAGLTTGPWDTGKNFTRVTLPALLGLTLLINSKNPLASVLRTKGKKREHVLWFLFFSLSGIILLVPFLIDGLREFSLFALLVMIYGILLYRGKEHSLLAELNGFALLTLPAPIVYFTVTGIVSLKLYAAVFLFFGAGVLKVRVRTRKTLKYRWIMVMYCAIAACIYGVLEISLIILLPFIENIISVIAMRDEKLRTTGNIELIKGIIFILLIGFFWRQASVV